MFGLQSGEVRDFWRKEQDDELHSFYSLHNIVSVFSSWWMRCEGACSMNGIEEKCTWAWYERLKGRGHMEDLDVDGKRFTWTLKEMWCEGVAGFSRLRVEISNWVLWARRWTPEFHKMRRTSRRARKPLASQGLCPVESEL